MTCSLDDFFKEVIHSEQKAQERKSLINGVKEQCVLVQAELKDAEQDYRSHQGQLVIKVQQCSEAKLQEKWSETRVKLLGQQKDDLVAENGDLDKKLDEIQKATMRLEQSFCHDVSNFCLSYDLVSGGQARRLQWVQSEIDTLIEEQRRLETASEAFEMKLQQVANLKGSVEQLEKRLEMQQLYLKELEHELQQKKGSLAKQRRRYADIHQVPRSNPEFRRLQAQLEACSRPSLEGRCTELQHQLQQLQQQQWQKSLQEKRCNPVRCPVFGQAQVGPVQSHFLPNRGMKQDPVLLPARAATGWTRDTVIESHGNR